MKLFQYGIFFNGKKKKDGSWEEEAKPKVIVDVQSILAKDETQALTLVSREIPDDWIDRLDELTLAVRPF